MIKLFVSDCDGTLLNDNSELDHETILAIKRFQDLGGIFMVATGRDRWQTDVVTTKVDNVVINSSNGSLLTDYDGKVLLSHHISNDNISFGRKISDQYDCFMEFRCMNNNYSLLNSETLKQKAVNNIRQHFAPELVQLLYDELFVNNMFYLNNIEEIYDKDVLKMELFFCGDKREEIYNILKDNLVECDIIIGDFCENIEITSILANKGKTIREYCKIKNISEDDVVVIGDSGNDVGMLKMFKNSYCVANGYEVAQKAANYKADSNNDLGVAKLLNKICDES